jgi:hypothetical protein
MRVSTPHKKAEEQRKTPARRALPRAFVRAAGLLKGKLKKSPMQYQRALRKEWS